MPIEEFDDSTKIDPLSIIGGLRQPDFDKPLMWPAGKASAIAYVDGAFPEDFCSSLIALCQSLPDKSFQGKTLGGVHLETKVSTDWHLDQAAGLPETAEQEYDKRIFDQLWRVLDLYRGNIPQLANPGNVDQCMVSDTGYQIQCYPRQSGFYGEHIDGAPWLNAASTRTLGVIVYLNTVVDGGGTMFPMHNLVVDAVAGRVAVFPANWTHPHCGMMPMSEDKWIISTFVMSAVSQGTACSCGACAPK